MFLLAVGRHCQIDWRAPCADFVISALPPFPFSVATAQSVFYMPAASLAINAYWLLAANQSIIGGHFE